MGRWIRIALLLGVLVTVAQGAWLASSRATAWNDPLRVSLYPMNGDGSTAAARYIESLRGETFQGIEVFFATESKRHGISIHRPLRLTLTAPIAALPPSPPGTASAVSAIFWSLHMRWWAWRNDTGASGDRPQARLYVLYFDPETHPALPHSVGLARGMIGLVNAFASHDMAGSNNVVIAHELLHTLGATDKYDPASNQPHFPEGYAEPKKNPRLPQDLAEIMGGRIPKSADQAEIPESLDGVVVGPETASEIGWKRPP